MSPARVHRSLPHRGPVRRGAGRPRKAGVGDVLRAQQATTDRLDALARKLAAAEADLSRIAADRAVIIARLDAVERAATGQGKGRV